MSAADNFTARFKTRINLSPNHVPERRRADRRVFALPAQETPARRIGDQKKVFMAFCAAFLGLPQDKIVGLQSCYNLPGREDLILFSGVNNSTLAIPISVLMMACEDARALVQAKLASAEESFRPKNPVTEKKGSWRLS